MKPKGERGGVRSARSGTDEDGGGQTLVSFAPRPKQASKEASII